MTERVYHHKDSGIHYLGPGKTTNGVVVAIEGEAAETFRKLFQCIGGDPSGPRGDVNILERILQDRDHEKIWPRPSADDPTVAEWEAMCSQYTVTEGPGESLFIEDEEKDYDKY